MNKHALIGQVSHVRTQEYPKHDGQGSYVKVSWSFAHKRGKLVIYNNCESGSQSFTQLKDGMVIQLTNYIPRHDLYVDKETGQSKYRDYIEVREAIVRDNPIDLFQEPIGLTYPKKQNNNYDPFVPQEAVQEFNRMVRTFDVKKEVANLKKQPMVDEIINLDDGNNIKHETTPLDDYVPQPVQKFPTQEFIDSLNNIPKPNNNTKVELKGSGGQIKDIDENEKVDG